jgi:LPS sulfotransferase NodH
MTRRHAPIHRHIRPRKFVILAEARSGGTFLATCLSNHPRIFCTRGEPLHQNSHWRTAAPDEIERLKLITNQIHYDVAGCKLMRNHFERANVFAWLCQVQPKVLYIWREDYVAQALSWAANEVHRANPKLGIPTHIYEPWDPVPIEIPPERVVFYITRLQQNYGLTGDKKGSHQAFLGRGKFKVLELTYEQITGGGEATGITGAVADEICDFLDVPRMDLPGGGLRRSHPRPWNEYVTNWAEVERAIAARLAAVHKGG